jgi:hypothetical protein
MSHKFSIGQAVMFTPGPVEVLESTVKGKITRLLPIDGTQYQYYVQAEPDGLERRVREDQLRAVIEADPG